jgi:hypothetical protein
VPSSVVKNHPNFCKSFILCFCWFFNMRFGSYFCI